MLSCWRHVSVPAVNQCCAVVAHRIARGREQGDETHPKQYYIIQGCSQDKKVATSRPGGPISVQHINPIHSNIIPFVLKRIPATAPCWKAIHNSRGGTWAGLPDLTVLGDFLKSVYSTIPHRTESKISRPYRHFSRMSLNTKLLVGFSRIFLPGVSAGRTGPDFSGLPYRTPDTGCKNPVYRI